MAADRTIGTRCLTLVIAILLQGCDAEPSGNDTAFASEAGDTEPVIDTAHSQFHLEPSYSTFLGGSHWERAQGVFVGDQGYIYIGGQTNSKNFPTTTDAYDRIKSGPSGGAMRLDTSDGFVAKLTPDGSRIVWSTLIGGSKRDQVYTVRADSQGNVYAIGSTGSPDFPTTEGAFDRTFNSRTGVNSLSHAFIAKFGRSGNLLFSTYIGGASDKVKATVNPRGAIHIDEKNGLIYFAGETTAEDFPVTPGAFQTSYGGGKLDAFVAALSDDGTELKYATFVGGSGSDSAFTEIEAHPDGSLYIGGGTSSRDFPTSPDVYQTALASGRPDVQWYKDGDAWVARISPKLDRLIFATYLGGNGMDAVSHNQGLAVDSRGRVVLIGMTESTDFPTTEGAFDQTHNGQSDGFAVILSEDGRRLEASTYIGGSLMDTTAGIRMDARDRLYFTGETESDDWPVTSGSFQDVFGNTTSGSGALDAYLTVLSPDLGSVAYSSYVGGTGTVNRMGERGRGTWIGRDGSVYLVGNTDSVDFPIIGPAVQPRHGGGGDAFLIRFDQP